MVNQELSDLFDKLSRELPPDVLVQVIFLIDDYLEAFEIPDDVSGQQMFDELHQHLGTRQMLQLLSEVLKAIDRMDLFRWIWNYAPQFHSEDVLRLEESPQRIPGDTDLATDASPASLDNSLCQQPSSDPDAGNSEGISSHNSSTSWLHGGLQPEDLSLDSLDSSRNRTIQDDDVIGPLTPSSQLSSGKHNSSGDSGLPSESAAPTTPIHSGSSSAAAAVEMNLETPIEMKTEEMKSYMDETQPIGEGGFGNVYKGIYKEKPVAIKTGRFVKSNERQFLKEKQLDFLRHTSIVPILAHTVEREDVLMIMYPYMDSGDLTKVYDKLDWRNRLRIFYQCAEGLAYLQRPVPGVRNEIIHGDIKPANILLDAKFNARLGDVGVAAELPKGATHCTTTGNMHYGTEGYEDPFRDDESEKVVRRKENDVFSLGIVGLQFLKWQPAVQSERRRSGAKVKLLLWDKLQNEIEPLDALHLMSSDKFFDRNIWHQDSIGSSIVSKEVVELVLACLKPTMERIAAEGLACKLKELLVSNNIPRYILTESKSCQYCCFNIADSSSAHILCSDTCPEDCKFKRLCQHCHQTAYRNPLYCPEHGRLKQFIRPEECFAILISGYDQKVEDQKTFDDDVKEMLGVISDPRVMGFNPDNITLINKNTMEKRKEIINAIQRLQQKDVEMLIVYYSGHGSEEDSAADLYISRGDTSNMKDHELRDYLDSVKCTRLLVILDCCYAGRYRVVLPKPQGTSENRLGWRIQLNAAGASKMADMTEDNKSVFTRHIVSAISPLHMCPSSDGATDEDAPPCRMCTKFKALSEARGHIDIYDVVGFCSEHIKLEAKNEEEEDQEPSMMAGELSGSAPFISTPKPFTHIFRFKNGEESEKFHLRHLKHEPDEILQQLWDKINACCSLPKPIDYRCLKMQGLVRAKEVEIRTRDELIQQFIRSHIVEVSIRSTGSDLDSNRHVVVFCLQNDKLTEILNSLETVYKLRFQKEQPRKEQDFEAEYSCIIKCGKSDEMNNTEESSCYDAERRHFSEVVRDSVIRSNTLSRKPLPAGQPPISGLRIDITTKLALLELV